MFADFLARHRALATAFDLDQFVGGERDVCGLGESFGDPLFAELYHGVEVMTETAQVALLSVAEFHDEALF